MNNLVIYVHDQPNRYYEQLHLCNVANELSKLNNFRVYFASDSSNIDKFNSVKVRKIMISDIQNNNIKEPIFLVPICDLPFLLDNIKHVGNYKICLFTYKKNLFYYFLNLAASKSLKDRNRIINFLNTAHCLCSTDPLVLPINVPKLVELPHICTIDEFSPAKGTRAKNYRLCFFANVTKESIFSLRKLILSFKEMRSKNRVDIHIIGNIIDRSFYDILRNIKLNGYLRVFFAGELKQHEISKYLHDNLINLIITYGYNSLNTASFGLPVSLISLNDKVEADVRFLWLHKVINNCDTFSVLPKNQGMSLKEMLNDVDKNGIQIAKECQKYASYRTHYSESHLNKISNFLLKTELTVEDCLNYIPRIKQAIKKAENKTSTNDVIYYLKKKNRNFKDKCKSTFLLFLNKIYKLCESFYSSFRSIRLSIHFSKCVKQIRKRDTINVAFLVTFKESFSSRTVFEKMLKVSRFSPKIIVTPNVCRGFKHQNMQFNDVYSSLVKEYGKKYVIRGYDSKNNTYLDLAEEYQLVVFSNPYKNYDHRFHNISYFLGKNVLPIYVNYAFPTLTFWDELFKFYDCMWKVPIENKRLLMHYRRRSHTHGRNAVLCGYLKMDNFSNYNFSSSNTEYDKTILICPHHTVFNWNKLNISNFLQYSKFLLELPKKYPYVKFIFRPHPLLWTHIVSHKIWSDDEVANYLKEIQSNSNVVYDASDDYYDKFAESDAIIHDCGSFIAEYLYTNKPCCYVMKNEKMTYKTLLPFAKKCMDCYYHAFNEKDIINFIENVVLGENDKLKAKRSRFVAKKIKFGYPHSTDIFVNHLLDKLKK